MKFESELFCQPRDQAAHDILGLVDSDLGLFSLLFFFFSFFLRYPLLYFPIFVFYQLLFLFLLLLQGFFFTPNFISLFPFFLYFFASLLHFHFFLPMYKKHRHSFKMLPAYKLGCLLHVFHLYPATVQSVVSCQPYVLLVMPQTSIKVGLRLSPLLKMLGFGFDFLCGVRRFVPLLPKITERAERAHVLMSCEFRMLQACDRFSVPRSRVGVCWPSNEKDSSMREVEQRKHKLTTTRVIKKHLEFD